MQSVTPPAGQWNRLWAIAYADVPSLDLQVPLCAEFCDQQYALQGAVKSP